MPDSTPPPDPAASQKPGTAVSLNAGQNASLSVSGSVVGGDMVHHHHYPSLPALPPIDPAQAEARLAQLPAGPDAPIPDHAPLPDGSTPLPAAPNPHFVGRTDELRTLAAAMRAGRSVVVHQPAAISGLGGVGKTQLALEFAHRYGTFFAGGVFWLNASSADSLTSAIAACGGTAGLRLRPDFDELKQVERYALVMAAWQQPIPRLLIFDNCETAELLVNHRPASGGCRLLLTSRQGVWEAGLGVQALLLNTLPRPDSLALLQALAPHVTEAEGDAIAQEVGDFPLALHLAGSYLATYAAETTPAAYLARLRAVNPLTHPSLQGRGSRFSPTGHERDVARTFALSYARLQETRPEDALARRLLAHLACLAPGETVPRGLLRLMLAEDEEATWTADGEEETDLMLADGLARLTALGLVEPRPAGGIALHRLMAAFVHLAAGELVEAVRPAVEVGLGEEAYRLNAAGYPAALAAWVVHLTHVVAAALPREDELAAALAHNLGYHLQETGAYATARPYYERALAIGEKVWGAEHPDTATSLNNLGSLLQDQGEFAAARPYLERALASREKVLGAEHPDIAQSLNNLGSLLQTQGEYAAARPYFEHALAIWEKVLGPQHIHTAISLNNLAGLLQAQGEYAAARPYFERALAIRQKVLGPEHPDTATNLNNLAGLLQVQGEYAAARPYFERALAIREKVLGLEHPDTAQSLNNLGLLLHVGEEYDIARPYYERALAIREKVLGTEHPHTANSLNNLGRLLQAQGEDATARFYFERALAICEKMLGPEHPDTAASLNNLGGLLQAQREYAAARPYLERALAIREKVLGPEHPLTAASLNNLGSLLHAQGESAAARPYLERALAICEKVLGLEHPHTQSVRRNLAALPGSPAG